MTKLLTYIFIFLFTFTSSVNAGYFNAINRGKTGAGIFSLKNFGNENTNGMSKTEWIVANADKDTISNGTLGLVSDLYNTATKKGEGEPQVVTATATVGSAIIASGIALAAVNVVEKIKDLFSDTLFNSDNSSGQEPENMDNNDNNGGDKDPKNPCLKNPELCTVATEESIRNSDKVEVVVNDIVNKANHIFNNLKHNHNLNELLEKFEGNIVEATNSIINSVDKYISKNSLSNGLHEFTIKVKGISVNVRGFLDNNKFQIGTVWRK